MISRHTSSVCFVQSYLPTYLPTHTLRRVTEFCPFWLASYQVQILNLQPFKPPIHQLANIALAVQAVCMGLDKTPGIARIKTYDSSRHPVRMNQV
jgi:hypothetical protein